MQVPTIGTVKFKEKGYLPTKAEIRSGTISFKAGRYYVSLLVEEPDKNSEQPRGKGIGIDLGVKELAVMSDGTIKSNINKTPRVKKVRQEAPT